MKQLNRHIVSNLNWNTSFDKKERASELQGRISTWSNLRLQRELADLFDSVCPPEQTWRIDTLDIDLGEIDYNNLESELSLRFRKQLMEKLTEMITYSGSSSHPAIEIIDEETSVIGLLESFLLYGVMPWNHTLAHESADRLMAYQLKYNKTAAVEMLWSAGAKSDNVRKRMAWQFSDPTVILIIRGLEPNNHQQIVEFSDNVTELQEKKKIVTSSVSDLRRQIWHWVLNYLYNERGTLFNKVAFLKSTIRQMADHFNVRYEELLELIERAVESLESVSASTPDFIQSLRILTAESRSVERREAATAEEPTDHWYTLGVLIRDQFLRRSATRVQEFNDLVFSLYRKDRQRLASLFRTEMENETLLAAVAADLSEDSMEVLLAALLPAVSPVVIRTIRFFEAISSGLKLRKEDRLPWRAALKFALQPGSVPVDRSVFISFIVAEIAGAMHLPVEEVMSELLSTRIPPEARTGFSLALYTDLLAIAEPQKEEGAAVFSGQLRELLDRLTQELAAASPERETLQSLRRTILSRITMHPHAALVTLTAYPDKNMLIQLLPLFTDRKMTAHLLRHSSSAVQEVLAQAERTAEKLKKTKAAPQLVELLGSRLHEWTLEALILHGSTAPAAVAAYLFTALEAALSKAHREQLLVFAAEIAGSGSSAWRTAAEKVSEEFRASAEMPVGLRVKQLMQRDGSTQRAIGKLLENTYSGAAFAAWGKAAPVESAVLLNYLLAGGADLLQLLVRTYAAQLVPLMAGVPESTINSQLVELYWECILDHDAHKGNVSMLKKIFREAVRYRFSVDPETAMVSNTAEEQKIQRVDPLTEKRYKLRSGDVVTWKELFALIESGLKEAKTALTMEGITYEWKELLELGLELRPSEVRRIIAGIPLTPARLAALKTSGVFTTLSLWIMSDQQGETSSAMEAIRMLYDLIVVLVSDNVADQFLDEFWAQAWAVVTTRTWSREELRKLIRTTFTRMAADHQVSAAAVLTEMKNNRIRITPALREDLVACFPAFAALPESSRNPVAGRKLPEYENRGLLDNLIEHLVTQKRIPSWFGGGEQEDPAALLLEVIMFHPVKFLRVMKHAFIPAQQMQWLSGAINFTELTRSVGYLHRDKQPLLSMLNEFHAALGKMTLEGIPVRVLQEILFTKLMKAWMSNNWRIVTVENIWNEIIWDAGMKYGIPKRNFIKSLGKALTFFPPAIRIALDHVMEQEQESGPVPEKKMLPKRKLQPASPRKPFEKPPLSGITVRNAGVVLLSSYIEMLFDRLGILSKRKFVSSEAQNDAVHYLQYVVTGLTKTEETFLPLNKVLCGLPIDHPVTDGITITEEQKKLIEGLIRAAIAHWPSIGDTSVDGFRGNWLVREGMLVEQPEKWDLIVEKRAYDILLNKSPYSFSIIKYPWMEKSMHVTWPY